MSETHSLIVPPNSIGGNAVRHDRLTDVVVSGELKVPQVGVVLKAKNKNPAIEGVFIADRREDTITYYLHVTTAEGVTFDADDVLWDGTDDYATVVSSSGPVYTQVVHVADPLDPKVRQRFNKDGAGYATFLEGDPQFDAFGRMQMAQMIAVGEYKHVVEDHPAKYWTLINGTASVTHDADSSMMVYSVGTASGDKAQRTTNQYHPSKPGTSQLFYTGLALGSAGQTNQDIYWGYVDDYNGLFFRRRGTTLQVVLRSDSSGSMTETVVDQVDWNVNKLNDNVIYDFELDVTKHNYYWGDLGDGRYRIGIVTPDGRRITCHQFENNNSKLRSYLRSTTLPLRWGIENTGATGSTAEMRVEFGAVFTESSDVKYSGELQHYHPDNMIEFTDKDNYVPFLSFRPKQLINGKPNRIIGFHETFDWTAIGDMPLHIGIFVKPAGTLPGASWSDAIVPNSMLEVSLDNSYLIAGTEKAIESFTIGPNQSDRVNLGDRILKSFGLHADGVTQLEFIFAARVMQPASDLTAHAVNLDYTKFWLETE